MADPPDSSDSIDFEQEQASDAVAVAITRIHNVQLSRGRGRSTSSSTPTHSTRAKPPGKRAPSVAVPVPRSPSTGVVTRLQRRAVLEAPAHEVEAQEVISEEASPVLQEATPTPSPQPSTSTQPQPVAVSDVLPISGSQDAAADQDHATEQVEEVPRTTISRTISPVITISIEAELLKLAASQFIAADTLQLVNIIAANSDALDAETLARWVSLITTIRQTATSNLNDSINTESASQPIVTAELSSDTELEEEEQPTERIRQYSPTAITLITNILAKLPDPQPSSKLYDSWQEHEADKFNEGCECPKLGIHDAGCAPYYIWLFHNDPTFVTFANHDTVICALRSILRWLSAPGQYLTRTSLVSTSEWLSTRAGVLAVADKKAEFRLRNLYVRMRGFGTINPSRSAYLVRFSPDYTDFVSFVPTEEELDQINIADLHLVVIRNRGVVNKAALAIGLTGIGLQVDPDFIADDTVLLLFDSGIVHGRYQLLRPGMAVPLVGTLHVIGSAPIYAFRQRLNADSVAILSDPNPVDPGLDQDELQLCVRQSHHVGAHFGDHSITLPHTTEKLVLDASVVKPDTWLALAIGTDLNKPNHVNVNWRPMTHNYAVSSKLSSISRSNTDLNSTATLNSMLCNSVDRRSVRVPLTITQIPAIKMDPLPADLVQKAFGVTSDVPDRTLAGQLTGRFIFAQNVNPSHAAAMFKHTSSATSIVSLLEKAWVMVFRLSAAERAGERLQLGYNGWDNFEWCEHVTTNVVTMEEIATMSSIAMNNLPTYLVGIDPPSSIDLTIWRMLATAGTVWPKRGQDRHTVADDIQWCSFNLAIIKTSAISEVDLLAIQPMLPTPAQLVSWMYRYAGSRHVTAQVFDAYHRACSIVGSFWIQVPIQADWPEQPTAQEENWPNTYELGELSRYEVTAELIDLFQSRTLTTMPPGAERSYYQAGHNKFDGQNRHVPSVFVAKGVDCVGVSQRVMTTPVEASFFLRLIPFLDLFEKGPLYEPALRLKNNRAYDWDFQMLVMYQVMSSFTATTYIAWNLTGRELTALQSEADDLPARLKMLYDTIIHLQVDKQRSSTIDLFHQLVTQAIQRSTGTAIPATSLMSASITIPIAAPEAAPVAHLAIATSPGVPPQSGTVLSIVSMVMELPAEWTLPTPGLTIEVSADIVQAREPRRNGLHTWLGCSEVRDEFMLNQRPETMITYGPQVVNALAICSRLDLIANPERHQLRQDVAVYSTAQQGLVENVEIRPYELQPLFIARLGIWAPGTIPTYYWDTGEISQPFWPDASVGPGFFKFWITDEIKVTNVGVVGFKQNRDSDVKEGPNAYTEMVKRMQTASDPSAIKDTLEIDDSKKEDKPDPKRKEEPVSDDDKKKSKNETADSKKLVSKDKKKATASEKASSSKTGKDSKDEIKPKKIEDKDAKALAASKKTLHTTTPINKTDKKAKNKKTEEVTDSTSSDDFIVVKKTSTKQKKKTKQVEKPKSSSSEDERPSRKDKKDKKKSRPNKRQRSKGGSAERDQSTTDNENSSSNDEDPKKRKDLVKKAKKKRSS